MGLGLGEAMEDYLEVIYILKLQNGYVRNISIANHMRYSRASVTVAMRGLKEKGCIVCDDAGHIELTEKGSEIAKSVYFRHRVLKEFLELLGVSPDTAERDACRVEHAISEETFGKIRGLTEELRGKKAAEIQRKE